MLIKDSVDLLIEGVIDDGSLDGSIEVPHGEDQSANLVISGSTEGVTLKNISISDGAGILRRHPGIQPRKACHTSQSCNYWYY